jgi:hypothetical protein
VQILFDGQPAPLIYLQDGQINAVVLWALSAGGMTKACVSCNAVLTNCLIEPVIQAAPAVFTLDGANAAALNQDGTINSAAHPAAAGTTVSIFATGLGPITPPAKDGAVLVPPLPANISDVNAEIVVSFFRCRIDDASPCGLCGTSPVRDPRSQPNQPSDTRDSDSTRIAAHVSARWECDRVFTLYLGTAN